MYIVLLLYYCICVPLVYGSTQCTGLPAVLFLVLCYLVNSVYTYILSLTLLYLYTYSYTQVLRESKAYSSSLPIFLTQFVIPEFRSPVPYIRARAFWIIDFFEEVRCNCLMSVSYAGVYCMTCIYYVY